MNYSRKSFGWMLITAFTMNSVAPLIAHAADEEYRPVVRSGRVLATYLNDDRTLNDLALKHVIDHERTLGRRLDLSTSYQLCYDHLQSLQETK